jgi:predicted RND superfamily exporter protein
LARKYHPDMHLGLEKKQAEDTMKEINYAYEVLSDNTKRQKYDEELKSFNYTGYSSSKGTNKSDYNYAKKNELQRIRRQVISNSILLFIGLALTLLNYVSIYSNNDNVMILLFGYIGIRVLQTLLYIIDCISSIYLLRGLLSWSKLSRGIKNI